MSEPNELRKRWDNIIPSPNVFILAADNKPLGLHIGYDDQLRKTLIVVSPFKSTVVKSSKAFDVKQFIRKSDKRRILQLSLISVDENEVFTRMCCDLINYSQSGMNESDAFKRFERRCRQWQNLFANAADGLMSKEAQRGLIGELLFIRDQIVKAERSIEEIVEGWKGPRGANQDFSYADGWIEIKTVLDQARTVKISSLDQLSRLDVGRFVINRLLQSVGAQNFTLNSLVKTLSEQIAVEPNTFQLFEGLLIEAGYVERTEYDEDHYILLETLTFDVDDKFPRLIRSKLPPALVEASYSIDIARLNEEAQSHGH